MSKKNNSSTYSSTVQTHEAIPGKPNLGVEWLQYVLLTSNFLFSNHFLHLFLHCSSLFFSFSIFLHLPVYHQFRIDTTWNRNKFSCEAWLLKKKNICKRATLSDKNVHFFQVALNILFWRVQFLGAFLNVSLGKCPMCISQKTDLLAKNDSLPIAHLFEWKAANIACVFFQNIFFTPMFVIKEYSASIRFTRFLLRTQESWADRTILLQWRERNKSCRILHHVYCLVIGNGLSWSCIFLMIGRPSKLFPVLRFRVNLFDFCTFHGNLPSFWNSSFRKDNRDGIVPLSQGGSQFSTHQLHSVFCKGLCSHAQEQCTSKCFLRNYFAFFLTRYTPL